MNLFSEIAYGIWDAVSRDFVAQSASRMEASVPSSETPAPDAIRRMADRLRHHRCEPGLLELHEEAARMLEELALVKQDADCLRIERDNLARGLVRALAEEAET